MRPAQVESALHLMQSQAHFSTLLEYRGNPEEMEHRKIEIIIVAIFHRRSI
jgi:hypothetical protein